MENPVQRTTGYEIVLSGVVDLLETARRTAARSVNAVMTAAYWGIGRWIVEYEQGGSERAEYGEKMLQRLSSDLTARFGRGFSVDNLETMRLFYLAYPPDEISGTPSRKSMRPPDVPDNSETASRISSLTNMASSFPLPWSHYVLLVRRTRSSEALDFYHSEALRGGWTVRQLGRQINSQYYERTSLSRDKAVLLRKGAVSKPEDKLTPDEEIRDPLVLEFLGLKDEYSESDLEEALIERLEVFLLELGNDFAFIGRQRRLRIDDEWYKVDLLFFHRRLRCLVVIDLKLGRFSHADAGQMNLYLNYAREHWTRPDENPPVGIILCSGKGEALVRYATDGLANKMLVREYLTALPEEKTLAVEIERARRRLEGRKEEPSMRTSRTTMKGSRHGST